MFCRSPNKVRLRHLKTTATRGLLRAMYNPVKIRTIIETELFDKARICLKILCWEMRQLPR